MKGDFRIWRAPKPDDVAEDVDAFLAQLGGATCIELEGQHDDELRVLTTLLHGNEPSGTRAVHRYLREGRRPKTNLWLVVASVEAATHAPAFSHRSLPGHRDLNRCFRAPFEGPEGRLARAIHDHVLDARPRALIDLHNTSGRGPAYAVSLTDDAKHLALTAHFAPRMIYTDLVLGTIIEATDPHLPSITIECGGARDERAHAVAFEGLCRFAGVDDVLEPRGMPPDVLSHPVRIELAPDTRLGFGDADPDAHDLVLGDELDMHNFGAVEAGATLGRLGPRGLSVLRARDGRGAVPVEQLFRNDSGQLVASHRFSPLMLTTNPEIALSDCLLYLVQLR